MPPDEPARPAPVVLRIKLRYDDVEVMIQRFSPNVGKTGLFLPTKSMQPIGAEVKFELRLSTDQPVLVGLGRVKASREPDPDNPKAAFGIAIELMRVTRESRDLILKMLERRKQLGLAEAGIPMPSDVDAARRSDFVETGVKAGLDSGPVSMPVPAPLPDSQPAELLTAPRRQTGPIAVARVSSHIEPLAAEPPRKKRVPVAELVASASGPVASASGPTAMIDFDLDGLENVVDIAAAIARARVLAGSDLDGELEALRDAGAAPIEIGIEAASAELARQLGGAAVNRSARWAPPPPVEDASARDAKIDAPAGDAKTDSAEIEAPPVPMSAPPPASRPDAAPAVEAMATHAAEPTPIEPAPTPIDPAPIDSVPDPIEREVVGPEVYEKSEPVRTPAPIEVTPIIDTPALLVETSSPDDELFRQRALVDDAEHEVEPDQIHDEIHRLTEGDFEEVENTQVGAMIVEPDQPEQRDSPEQAAIADRLERQLVEAEAEADADDLGFSLPHHQPGDERRHLEFALAAAVEQEQQDEEIEEIEEFEILAEADEQDADLLTAAAEQELSQQHVMGVGQPAFRAFDEPASRPSFLSRLELDDDSGYHAPVSFDDPPPRNEFDELAHEPEIDPRVMSAGHALRQFESYEHPAYTTPDPEDFSLPDPRSNAAAAEPTFLAGFPDEFDAPHGNYGEPPPQYVAPDAFDQSDVISIHPDRPQGSIKPRPSSPPRAADVDLETALEALDVDLDDLGAANAPHSKRGPVVRAGKNRKAPKPTASNLGEAPPAAATRTPLRRASTEDGIDIDFDDE